jgi:hypothetical protein
LITGQDSTRVVFAPVPVDHAPCGACLAIIANISITQTRPSSSPPCISYHVAPYDCSLSPSQPPSPPPGRRAILQWYVATAYEMKPSTCTCISRLLVHGRGRFWTDSRTPERLQARCAPCSTMSYQFRLGTYSSRARGLRVTRGYHFQSPEDPWFEAPTEEMTVIDAFPWCHCRRLTHPIMTSAVLLLLAA